MKAAHLVPKSLSQEEAYLFGVKELVLSDAKNGIAPHTLIYIILHAILIAKRNHTT